MMKKDNVLLSFIVPIYNADNYLMRCVESIRQQGFDESDYEIVLINDGSTDNSYQVAADLSKLHSNIRLFSQENKGQSSARNVGIQKSLGKYLLFVDADDYLINCSLREIVRFSDDNHLEIGMTQLSLMHKNGKIEKLELPTAVEKKIYDGKSLFRLFHPASACAVLFLRKFLQDQHLFFTEKIMHEDVLFVTKAFLLAKRIFLFEETTYVYFWNSQSTDRFVSQEKRKKSLMSDIFIARDLKNFAEERGFLSNIKADIEMYSNRIVLSVISSLFRKDKWLSIIDKKTILNQLEKCQLLPINGPTASISATIFKYLIGYPPFLKLMLSAQNCLIKH